MVKKMVERPWDHVFFTGEQRQRDDIMVYPTPRDGSGWTRCACVAREVSVERGGMGERGCARRLGGWVWV